MRRSPAASGGPVRARRGQFLASPYLLLLPAASRWRRVSLYPLFYGVRASFTHYLYGRDFGFDGLTNYRIVWNDDVLPPGDA